MRPCCLVSWTGSSKGILIWHDPQAPIFFDVHWKEGPMNYWNNSCSLSAGRVNPSVQMSMGPETAMHVYQQLCRCTNWVSEYQLHCCGWSRVCMYIILSLLLALRHHQQRFEIRICSLLFQPFLVMFKEDIWQTLSRGGVIVVLFYLCSYMLFNSHLTSLDDVSWCMPWMKVPTETPWVHVGCMDHIELKACTDRSRFGFQADWAVKNPGQTTLPAFRFMNQAIRKKRLGWGWPACFFSRSYKEVTLEPSNRFSTNSGLHDIFLVRGGACLAMRDNNCSDEERKSVGRLWSASVKEIRCFCSKGR